MSENPYQLPPRRYSYDEIAAWPDEARRELHDGSPTLIYAPGYSRTLGYSRATRNVLWWLNRVNPGGSRGKLYYLVDWQLNKWTSLVADLCFFRRERLAQGVERADGRCLLAAPDLVVHVRDSMSATFAAYRQLMMCQTRAVPFFWSIDAETGRGLALHLENGAFVPEADYRDDEVFSCPLFPDAQLTLAEIFAEDAP